MMNLGLVSQKQQNEPLADYLAATELRAQALGLASKTSNPQRKAGSSYPIFKRLLDICVSLTAIIILAPFLLIVAIMIRLDSKGPALFRQERNGLNGQLFTIYKFRTMSVMESGMAARQACASDPRISRLGCTLRTLSIDELPQLFNVLLGNMSLVGPRPHPPALDAFFAPKIPGYMSRYDVKPGLTGLAQVEGARGETATTACMARRINFDRAYVKTANFGLDCWIIIKTAVMVVLRPNGG
ncbi:MAG: hypothetical protein RLZZ157_458 [Pseudomonadota bacterium]